MTPHDDLDILIAAVISGAKGPKRHAPSMPTRRLTPEEVNQIAPPAQHEGVAIIMPVGVDTSEPRLPEPPPRTELHIADGPRNGFAYAVPRVTMYEPAHYYGRTLEARGNVLLAPLTNSQIHSYALQGKFGRVTQQAAIRADIIKEGKRRLKEQKQREKAKQLAYHQAVVAEVLGGL